MLTAAVGTSSAAVAVAQDRAITVDDLDAAASAAPLILPANPPPYGAID
jgi:hypothetical protein